MSHTGPAAACHSLRHHHSFVPLVAALLLIAGVPAPQPDRLRVDASPMRLRASGVAYAGVTKDMDLEDLARARKDEFWQEVQWKDTTFFPAHFLSLDGGLGAYTPGAKTWTWYPMSALAVAAKWYVALKDDDDLSADIHGVAIGGGRVWMGSIGIGIVAKDLRDGTWSRYDVKAQGLPGIHSMVLYADDEYVIGKSGGPSGGWMERLPGVREGDLGPALEVYSLRQDRWLRVRAVPRSNVVAFGWSGTEGVSMPCDTREYATVPFLPLELCTWPLYGKAASGGYELGRDFSEPGSPIRFVIRKDQLATAFDAMK